jgi:hypothetical protein
MYVRAVFQSNLERRDPEASAFSFESVVMTQSLSPALFVDGKRYRRRTFEKWRRHRGIS